MILAGHEEMGIYVKEAGDVSCIVFNFGYLPGGDHSLTTKSETSIKALEIALTMLKSGGMISLCIYSGGADGCAEREALLQWMKGLDQNKYLAIVSEYYNLPSNSPLPAVVIRK